MADEYNTDDPPVLIQAAQREYDLPIIDTDGAEIRIKDIYGHRCFRADGTEVSMLHLTYNNFIKRTPNFPLNFVGTPSYFALWGKSNKLYLDYFPSEDYTLTLYVESYPIIMRSTQLTTPLPVDPQWDIVVEAFATKHCYLKLQQTEMYQFWDDLYDRQKSSISRNESTKQSHNVDAGAKVPSISDPVLNPFINNWNN